MTISVSNVDTSQSFGSWLSITNKMARLFSQNTVTVDSTSGGSQSTGSAYVNGSLGATYLYANTGIVGGNVSTNTSLYFLSNSAFRYSISSANIFVVTATNGTYSNTINYANNILISPSGSGITINANSQLALITGNTTFNVNGTYSAITFTGNSTNANLTFQSTNTTVVGNLTVTDTINVGTLTVQGLTVNGPLNLSNTLTVNGAVTFANTFFVNGAVTFANAFFVNGAVTVNNNLTVNGSVTTNNTLTVKGSLTANSTLSVNGAATFTNTFFVNGSITANSILSVNGAATFANTLSVTGNSLFSNFANFKTYIENSSSPVISASALTLDLSNTTFFTVNLNSSITSLSITNTPATTNAVSGFVLVLTADGTARTVVWPASVRWNNGISPSITSTNLKRDIYTFFTTDNGTSYNAFISGQNL